MSDVDTCAYHWCEGEPVEGGACQQHWDDEERLRKLTRERDEAREALRIIAGGLISPENGGPLLNEDTDPAEFRSAMWSWSQRIARTAIDAARGEGE